MTPSSYEARQRNRLGILLRHPWNLLWVVVAYLPFLGFMSVPLTGDQKVYLSTSMEMRQQGSVLMPLLFGEGSYYKPPVQYWTTLVGWEVFGFNFWGALMPSLLALILTAWLMAEIARSFGQKRWSVNTGLLFAAALGTAVYGTTAQMEIYLVLFYAGAWWAALKFLADPHGQRKWRWIYLAFIVTGISGLVKSPLYSVLWVAGFGLYLLISGEWLIFRSKHLYLACLVGILCGVWWYLLILYLDGDRFWSDYILRETWNKKSGNSSSPWSLWGALLYFSLPFSLLLFPSLRALWRMRRSGPILRFALAWSVFPAVFFTLYPYRIKPYLYILVPIVMLIIDWGHFRLGRSRAFRIAKIGTGVLMLVALSGLGLILYRGELAPAWVGLGFVLTGVCGLIVSFAHQLRPLIACGLAAMFLFRAAAVSLGEWDISGLHEALVDQPDRQVVMLDEKRNIWHEVGLLSVGVGRPFTRVYTDAQILEALDQGAIAVLSDEQSARLEKKLGPDFSKLSVKPWPRWRVRAKFPFKELVRGGKRSIANFDELTKREFQIIQKDKGI